MGIDVSGGLGEQAQSKPLGSRNSKLKEGVTCVYQTKLNTEACEGYTK